MVPCPFKAPDDFEVMIPLIQTAFQYPEVAEVL